MWKAQSVRGLAVQGSPVMLCGLMTYVCTMSFFIALHHTPGKCWPMQCSLMQWLWGSGRLALGVLSIADGGPRTPQSGYLSREKVFQKTPPGQTHDLPPSNQLVHTVNLLWPKRHFTEADWSPWTRKPMYSCLVSKIEGKYSLPLSVFSDKYHFKT